MLLSLLHIITYPMCQTSHTPHDRTIVHTTRLLIFSLLLQLILKYNLAVLPREGKIKRTPFSFVAVAVYVMKRIRELD